MLIVAHTRFTVRRGVKYLDNIRQLVDKVHFGNACDFNNEIGNIAMNHTGFMLVDRSEGKRTKKISNQLLFVNESQNVIEYDLESKQSAVVGNCKKSYLCHAYLNDVIVIFDQGLNVFVKGVKLDLKSKINCATVYIGYSTYGRKPVFLPGYHLFFISTSSQLMYVCLEPLIESGEEPDEPLSLANDVFAVTGNESIVYYSTKDQVLSVSCDKLFKQKKKTLYGLNIIKSDFLLEMNNNPVSQR